MKILFTGASSFTGLWFVQELAKAGHEVTVLFRCSRESYQGLRRERVDKTCSIAVQSVFDCPFGNARFLQVLEEQWDLLCHHGAETRNYKSAEFDVLGAVANNTHGLREVLGRGIKKIVLTGSIFSPGEGAGSDELRAFSPYGVSKGLTKQLFQYYCQQAGVFLSHFVIANPFGPFEEPRYVDYLLRQWLQDKIAEVQTPLYVRDNIPVSLLARAYTGHCMSQEVKAYPSGYVESQATFTERLAQAMRPRLNRPCEYVCAEQTFFAEPVARFNTDPVDRTGWDEEQAWDEMANYYRQRCAVGQPA